MSRVVVGAFALVLSSLCSPAFAQTWTVERVQGPAWIQDGTRRAPLEVGLVVREGVQIVTAHGARVMLTGPEGAMMVGPNSSLEVRAGVGGLETTVVQRGGVVEFDLSKRGKPYFSVETPAMAAVVKGTRFVMMVAGRRSDVGVREGVVAVQDFRSGQMATLRAGERAATRPSLSGLMVGGPKAPPSIYQGVRRSALVRPTPLVHAPPLGAAWKIGDDGWAEVTTEEGQFAAAKARKTGVSGKANGQAGAGSEADASEGADPAGAAAANGAAAAAAGNAKGAAGAANGNGAGNGNAGGNGNGNGNGNGGGRGRS